MNSALVGTLWETEATEIFTTKTKTKVDPSTVTCTVTDPLGAKTTPAVVRDNVGVYHAQFPLTKPGTWLIVWTTAGSAQAIEEEEVTATRKRYV